MLLVKFVACKLEVEESRSALRAGSGGRAASAAGSGGLDDAYGMLRVSAKIGEASFRVQETSRNSTPSALWSSTSATGLLKGADAKQPATVSSLLPKVS